MTSKKRVVDPRPSANEETLSYSLILTELEFEEQPGCRLVFFFLLYYAVDVSRAAALHLFSAHIRIRKHTLRPLNYHNITCTQREGYRGSLRNCPNPLISHSWKLCNFYKERFREKKMEWQGLKPYFIALYIRLRKYLSQRMEG